MNELHNHKKRDGIKWVIVFTAIALLAVMVAAAITQGFTNANPWGWLDKPAAEDKAVGGELAAVETGGAIIGESAGSGIKLLSEKISPVTYSENGISSQAESAFVLEAIVEPSNAKLVYVDWSVSWADTSNTWAFNEHNSKTVTDYLTLTPKYDGSLKVDIVCLQAFGAQIKIECKQRNGSAKAECTVDYAKKIKRFGVAFTEAGGGAYLDDEIDIVARNNSNYNFTFQSKGYAKPPEDSPLLYSSAYTIDDAFSKNFTIEVNPEMLGYFAAEGLDTSSITSKEYSDNDNDPCDLGNPWYSVSGGTYFLADLFAGNAIDINKAVSIVDRHRTIPVYTLTYNAVGTYSTLTLSVSMFFAESSLDYKVTGLSFSDNNIIL